METKTFNENEKFVVYGKYIPLDVMSDFSRRESIAKISELVSYAKSSYINVLALTDTNLGGAIDFYQLCLDNKIKPIIGQKIIFNNISIILLCKDFDAYKILCKYSVDFQNTKDNIFSLNNLCLTKDESSHFVCLANTYNSELEIFFGNDFYTQVTFSEIKNNSTKLQNLNLNQSVITNTVRYIKEDENVALNLFRKKFCNIESSEDFDNYFVNDKSEIVKTLMDSPNKKLLDNIHSIIDKISFIFPNNFFNTTEIHKRIIDSIPDINDSENLILNLCLKTLEEKKNEFEDLEGAKSRLDFELNKICKNNWQKVFLFYQEIISWCKENKVAFKYNLGLPMCSLVTYLLGISNLNPMKYGLLYERFLNPNRLCFPEFDIQFDYECMEELLNHLKEKYGDESILGIPHYYGVSEYDGFSIAGEYLNLKVTDPVLLKHYYWYSMEIYNKLCRIAYPLKDVINNTILFNTEFIIKGKSENSCIPVLKDVNSKYYCPCTSTICENKIGIFKINFGFVEKFDIHNEFIDYISKSTDKEFDVNSIPLDDEKVLSAWNKEAYKYCPPKKQKFARKVLETFTPKNFNDLIILTTILRPGLKDFRPYLTDLINSEENKNPIPFCEDILKETYGIPLYQEQIMQIISKLTYYNLGDADLLRRALCSKKELVIRDKKFRFVSNVLKKGLITTKEESEEIFDALAIFTPYSAPKFYSAYLTQSIYYDMYFNLHYHNEWKNFLAEYNLSSREYLSHFYYGKESLVDL